MEQKRILVVDDEPHARDGLTKILQRSGYLVISAKDGFDALQKAREQNYHLVITDIKMPGMDGIQLLKSLKSELSDVGVIMVTAFCEVDSYISSMHGGASEYINKPIKVDELKKVVEEVINRGNDYQHPC